MPKRDANEIQHSVALTDHRIPAVKGEPYPDSGFRETGANTPGLIHLNAIRDNEASVPPITLLKAYGQLIGKQYNEYQQPYATLLNALARTNPEDLYVLEALAMQDLQQATAEGYRDAINKFWRAIELGSTSVTDYQTFADLLVRAGEVEQATQLLKRALTIDRYNEATYRSLADLYSFLMQNTEAVATLEEALKLFPQDTSLRDALREVQAMRVPN
jgi:tetratricopeptide (TPR) repeat protein